MSLNLNIKVVATEEMLEEFLFWYGQEVSSVDEYLQEVLGEWISSNIDRFLEYKLEVINESSTP